MIRNGRPQWSGIGGRNQAEYAPKSVCVKNIFDFVGTNVVAVNWDEELTDKNGNQFQFTGVTVITLKLGKATHAQDYIFNTDEELRKAWGE